MPISDLQKRLEDSEDARKQLAKRINAGQATLAELADAERAFHAVIDRHGQNDKLVSILQHDAKAVRQRIANLRQLQGERRSRAAKLGDRAKRLRRRLQHASTKDVASGDQGPDVSVYQGSVDWARVADGHSFGFTKATEGRTYSDPTFSSGRLGAMRASLQAGAYHFARPDLNSAEDEAAHFVAVVKAAGGKFISLAAWLRGEDGVLGALDFEHTPYSAPWAEAWGRKFEQLTGVKAIIYGGGYSLQPAHSALGAFAGVWIAGYPNWSGFTVPPDPFLHQFTSGGSVAGVPGPCDVSKVL